MLLDTGSVLIELGQGEQVYNCLFSIALATPAPSRKYIVALPVVSAVWEGTRLHAFAKSPCVIAGFHSIICLCARNSQDCIGDEGGSESPDSPAIPSVDLHSASEKMSYEKRHSGCIYDRSMGTHAILRRSLPQIWQQNRSILLNQRQ